MRATVALRIVRVAAGKRMVCVVANVGSAVIYSSVYSLLQAPNFSTWAMVRYSY